MPFDLVNASLIALIVIVVGLVFVVGWLVRKQTAFSEKQTSFSEKQSALTSRQDKAVVEQQVFAEAMDSQIGGVRGAVQKNAETSAKSSRQIKRQIKMLSSSKSGVGAAMGMLASWIDSEMFGRSNEKIYKLKGIHEGETCVILGNGPSLSKADEDFLNRTITFGTNGVYKLHKPDYYCVVSPAFASNNFDDINALDGGTKFVINKSIKDFTNGFIGINGVGFSGVPDLFHFPIPIKFSRRPDRIVYLGGSVLFACLQLALWMGFDRVVMLGVDHDFYGKEDYRYLGKNLKIEGADPYHFSEDYLKDGEEPHCDMLATERAFALAKAAFEEQGKVLVNATPGSKLEVLEKVTLRSLEL